MPTIAEAAAQVLRKAKSPLHSHEIVERIRARGDCSFRGASPDHSVQAAIWKHINRCGNALGFEMVGRGRFKRKYWLRDKPIRADD